MTTKIRRYASGTGSRDQEGSLTFITSIYTSLHFCSWKILKLKSYDIKTSKCSVLSLHLVSFVSKVKHICLFFSDSVLTLICMSLSVCYLVVSLSVCLSVFWSVTCLLLPVSLSVSFVDVSVCVQLHPSQLLPHLKVCTKIFLDARNEIIILPF